METKHLKEYDKNVVVEITDVTITNVLDEITNDLVVMSDAILELYVYFIDNAKTRALKESADYVSIIYTIDEAARKIERRLEFLKSIEPNNMKFIVHKNDGDKYTKETNDATKRIVAIYDNIDNDSVYLSRVLVTEEEKSIVRTKSEDYFKLLEQLSTFLELYLKDIDHEKIVLHKERRNDS